MSIDELLLLVQASEQSKLVRRYAKETVSLERRLPADYEYLIVNCSELEVFSLQQNGQYSSNGWQILTGRQPVYTAQIFNTYENDMVKDYFANCAIVASWVLAGNEMANISFNNDENYGKIFLTYNVGGHLGYKCPIIADSITEFLELTLAGGFFAEERYFLMEDFAERGPIIKNDPVYVDRFSIFNS